MPRRHRGFTLLELLVVLVIMGLAAAMATPALLKLVNSLEKQNNRDTVAVYLQKLPVQVMRQGRPYRLAATPGYIPLAEALGAGAAEALRAELGEVRVWIPEPIEYRTNGACSGGVTHWEVAGVQRFTLTLAAPLCRPRAPV